MLLLAAMLFMAGQLSPGHDSVKRCRVIHSVFALHLSLYWKET